MRTGTEIREAFQAVKTEEDEKEVFERMTNQMYEVEKVVEEMYQERVLEKKTCIKFSDLDPRVASYLSEHEIECVNDSKGNLKLVVSNPPSCC